MTWWQSLLIALVPAIITAAITLAVCLIQNHKTKKEFIKKYELDQKKSYQSNKVRYRVRNLQRDFGEVGHSCF